MKPVLAPRPAIDPLSPDYPRVMYHPSEDPVTVYSADEEAALGAAWSRRIAVSLAEEPPSAPPATPKRGQGGRFTASQKKE